MGTRTGIRQGRGWRDTDVWLDPGEVEWFGELSRTVRAAVSPQPVLAGIDGGAIAWPGAGPRPLSPAEPARIRRKRPGPSRGRRLATRLFPTVAALVAAGLGVPVFLASRAAEPLAASAAPAPAPSTLAPTLFAEGRGPAATGPAAIAGPAASEGPTGIAEPAAASLRTPEEPGYPAIRWRSSRAIGAPHDGRLVDGVRLPVEGPGWVTWDPVRHRIPDRANRLFGTDTLVRLVLDVVHEYRLAHPNTPRVVIGDLSRRGGGEIDEHVSHENGLDVDVYYPRRDRRLRPPTRVSQVNVRLAQDLLDRFVAAGAQVVFVGYSMPLRGPNGVVVPYAGHDNHMHVRIARS